MAHTNRATTYELKQLKQIILDFAKRSAKTSSRMEALTILVVALTGVIVLKQFSNWWLIKYLILVIALLMIPIIIHFYINRN